jgi:hypothetical protein
MPTARALFAALQGPLTAEPPVVLSAWTHLASFAERACHHLGSFQDDDLWFLRDVFVASAHHPAPAPNPENDAKWSQASWTPAPRNEAAQALPRFAHFRPDDTIFLAIEKLATDPVPSVRFLLASELWHLWEHQAELMWRVLTHLAEHEQNQVVLRAVSRSISNLISFDRGHSLALLRVLFTKVGGEALGHGFGADVVCMLTDFAVCHREPWAELQLAHWRETPLKYAPFLAESGRRLVAHLCPQEESAFFGRARLLLLKHLDAVGEGLGALKASEGITLNQEQQKTRRQLYEIVDHAVSRIYFAMDVAEDRRRQGRDVSLDDAAREKFFRDTLPVLDALVRLALFEAGVLFASTAHHFMELLNGVLPYDPPLVLRMAADVVRASQPYNYTLDSMALGEVVKLVEKLLADYRLEIQDEPAITHLLNLLDAFVEAGWPDALRLVWRLDEIYR